MQKPTRAELARLSGSLFGERPEDGESGARNAQGLAPKVSHVQDPAISLRYHLRKREHKVLNVEGKKYGRWARNIGHTIYDVNFKGDNPIEVIRFLHAFVSACIANMIPECSAAYLAKYFLRGTSLGTYQVGYRAARKMGATYSDGSFNSWPGAVNFLITTNLTDCVLDEAAAKFRAARQTETQTARQLYDHFIK